MTSDPAVDARVLGGQPPQTLRKEHGVSVNLDSPIVPQVNPVLRYGRPHLHENAVVQRCIPLAAVLARQIDIHLPRRDPGGDLEAPVRIQLVLVATEYASPEAVLQTDQPLLIGAGDKQQPAKQGAEPGCACARLRRLGGPDRLRLRRLRGHDRLRPCCERCGVRLRRRCLRRGRRRSRGGGGRLRRRRRNRLCRRTRRHRVACAAEQARDQTFPRLPLHARRAVRQSAQGADVGRIIPGVGVAPRVHAALRSTCASLLAVVGAHHELHFI
mmetsp:Transcript_93182/g.268197  ORF Transcript_93182/g.268197 Transcript_93182/m.268197 type:complete len:271 (-) Transcript_93182:567-1379(-)